MLSQQTEASNLTSINHGPWKTALSQQTEASNLTSINHGPWKTGLSQRPRF